MFNNTFIIAIEGADGLGKSSQTKLLQKKLNDAISQKIPSRDGISYEKIYDMLKNGTALKHPNYFQNLQAHNRLWWQKTTLPALASQYQWIILDRWNLSSWAYGEMTNIPKKDLQMMMEDLIEPDLYFIFDGESFKSNKIKDSYEEDKVLQNNVRQKYIEYSKQPNRILINSNNNIDTITEKLYSGCMELFCKGLK